MIHFFINPLSSANPDVLLFLHGLNPASFCARRVHSCRPLAALVAVGVQELLKRSGAEEVAGAWQLSKNGAFSTSPPELYTQGRR